MGPLRRLPAGDHVVMCCHVKMKGPQHLVVLPSDSLPGEAQSVDQVNLAKWVMLCIPCANSIEQGGDGAFSGAPYKLTQLTREITLPG